MAVFDAIIALAHFDLAAPAFGIGTCWAGFVAEAVREYEPLRQELNLPDGRELACAMMLGHPQYRVHAIPGRKPLEVAWI
jgi:nitroreductase